MSNFIKPPYDGGPAFPSPDFIHPNGQIQFGTFGMSLRDYFAGQALNHIPALLTANEKNRSVEMIAAWSYEVADAMLKAREEAP
jgi:hypothetical protein